MTLIREGLRCPVLGVDPGMTTGLFWLPVTGLPLAFQCNAPGAYPLASWLLEAHDGPVTVTCAGERFTAGRGAGARGLPATATRKVIADLDGLAQWHWRSAAQVKPWATDRRLAAAGLAQACHGMPHAADAARHALFAAVHDAGYPDPLRREAAAAWQLLCRPLRPDELP